MDGGAIAVVAFLIGLAGSEMERPGDFLVEEDVAHRVLDVGIEPERKFTDVPRARIGVEDLVQPPGVVGSGFDDLAVCKFEPDVFKLRSGVDGGRVELDDTVDRVLYRTGKDFAI